MCLSASLLPIFVVLLAQLVVARPPSSFSSCFVNDSGFWCCSRVLESAMKRAMGNSIIAAGDLMAAADAIQKSVEGALGGKFETVVAFDDFAHKSHFKDGMSCKVESQGLVALAWQP